MKNLILIIFASIIFQSCTTTVVPLKGRYQSGPVKSKVNYSFDQVWESTIDYIAESGVSVKIIDKSSGIIIADVLSFAGSLSQEDNKGNLINPDAFIAVERSSDDFPGKDVRQSVGAQWNLRIKAESDKTTVLSVNLHSIRVDKALVYLSGQSTGNMERMIIDEIIGGLK